MYEAFVRAGYADAAAAPSAMAAYPGAPANLQTTLLTSMLDEIDYGLLLLGADAHILLANHSARLELDAGRFVRRAGDRLVPSSGHDTGMDAAFASARRGLRSLVTLERDGGELSLSIVPLASGTHPTAPTALVVLGRRAGCETLTLSHYGQSRGLTAAEQALLPAVLGGSSIKSIARQQHVSPSTVRTQLGSIRAKIGAKSLRSLVVRLTSLPPIRPSLKTLRAC